MEISRLTRDGTAEPVLRDQIIGRERGQGNIILDREISFWTGKYHFVPVKLTTSRIGNLTRLILNVAICDDHTYIQEAGCEARHHPRPIPKSCCVSCVSCMCWCVLFIRSGL